MSGILQIFMRRLALPLVVLAIVVAVAAPAAFAADAWSRTTLQSGSWQTELRAGEGAVTVSCGTQTIRLVPTSASGARATDTLSCTPPEGDGSTRTAQATFKCGGTTVTGTFVLSPNGTIEIRPGEGLSSISIEGPIRYGVLPGIFLEDIIYDPAKSGKGTVYVPSENLILGFMDGGAGIVACTWPEGKQKLSMRMPGTGMSAAGAKPAVDGIDLTLDGRSAYLTILAAPDIWKKIELQGDWLERDVELPWKRPFDARWKTELLANDVKTTHVFSKGQTSEWRPFQGFFVWPVWFDGEKSMIHLSKKIPPEGDAFIWPLDGNEKTPLAFAKRTPCAPIFAAIERREPYPNGPRGVPDLGYTHCWGTAIAKRTLYQYGFQNRDQEFIDKQVDYCMDYVAIIQTRSMQFRDFMAKMSGTIDDWSAKEQDHAGALEFLGAMKDKLQVAQTGWQARVEGSGEQKSPEAVIEYCNKLGARLKEIARSGGTEYYPEEMMILSAFNGLSAACDEDIPAAFGSAMRDWFTNAAYLSANKPEAIPYAQSIRKAVREKLKCRNWETTGL